MAEGSSFQKSQNKLRRLEKQAAEHKRAEEELRVRNAYLEHVFESVPDAVVVADEEHLITRVNKRFTQLFGYTLEEAEGKRIDDLIAGEDLWEEASELTSRVMHGERVWKETLRYRKNGSPVWVEILASPIWGEEGQVGTYASYRDISARKQAEQALKESEKRYRELINSIRDAILVADTERNIVDCNVAFTAEFGYTLEEIRGRKTSFIYDDYEEYEKMGEELRKSIDQPHFIYIIDYKRKSGEVFTGETNVFYLKDSSEDVVGFIGVIRDVTGQKRTEQALRESEERYRILVEESPLAVALIGKDGRYKYLNPKFTGLFGYTLEDIPTGSEWFRKAYPDKEYRHQVISTWIKDQEEFGAGETRLRTYRVTCKDGSEKVIHIRSVAMESGDGLLIYEDITETELLEEQLRQSQKMEAIGRLAGGVAHDFNNILTTIIGNAEIALMDLSEKEPLYNTVEEIRGAGEKASGLTRQLLAFSRRQILQPEIMDLNDLLPAMDKLLRRIIGEDIELETLLDPELGLIEADPGQVEQIVMNLAVNARDAMPEGGTLTIETANMNLDETYSESHGRLMEPGAYVMLAVSDTGVGMTPEVRSQVFDPFFTTKEKGKGTGLGLSTVYGTVKQSKGYIHVESEPGEGTSFKIYFPRVERESREREKKRAQPGDLRGSETVLVVEDDEAVRDIAVQSLRLQGYTVLTAADGNEAVRVLKGHGGDVHLMLTDVVMPGMSGKETAEKVKRLAPDMKVLYMSGYTDNNIVHHGVLEKGVDFIQKPFTPEELVGHVRKVLDRR